MTDTTHPFYQATMVALLNIMADLNCQRTRQIALGQWRPQSRI